MPTRRKPTPAPSDQHKRAVAAVQLLFRLFPLETATWLSGRLRATKTAMDIHEASFIEQPPRGPAYAVPAPRPEPAEPRTPEELVKKVVHDALVRDAAASGGEVQVLTLDLEEERRQAIARGGCEVELLMRAQVGRRKPFWTLLGVALPGEHDDGSEMPWNVLEKTTWQLIASEKLIHERDPKAHPTFQTVPLYLWPWTGLVDPQEHCPVWKGEFEAPGLLGDLLRARSEKEKEREREQNRKYNRERVSYHRKLDRERRASAARRRERMGDAGITEEKLARLVPEIDVERDHWSMRLCYSIVRLWEEPADALLEQLPPEAVGLSLFGWRPAEVSIQNAFMRCAWVLRRGLGDADPLRRQRAAAALATLGAVHVDPDEVKRTLSRMKLL